MEPTGAALEVRWRRLRRDPARGTPSRSEEPASHPTIKRGQTALIRLSTTPDPDILRDLALGLMYHKLEHERAVELLEKALKDWLAEPIDETHIIIEMEWRG